MITYEVMQQVEGDTEKHSNWELINYEIHSPNKTILAIRDKEAKRIQQSFVTSIKQSLINNNN